GWGGGGGGGSGAVGLKVAVADGVAGQFGDVGGDEGGVGGGVVHVLAGAVTVEPVADVEVLLEVVPEREVEERALGGGQLHGGGQPALDDGEVADAQMLVEPVDVAAQLKAGSLGEGRRVDAGAGHHDHPQLRHALVGQRVGGDDLVDEGLADAAAADGDHADQFVVAVPQLGAEQRQLVGPRWGEASDVARVGEMLRGPVPDGRQVAAEGVRHDVVVASDEDGPVPYPRVAVDVLDHLGVVVGGQEGLPLPAVGHRQVADEVGQPYVLAPFQLRVLVPVVVDVPGFVADDQVVAALLDDLLEHHEVGHQDLVHPAQRLEAVQVVPVRFGGHVRGFAGQSLAGGVDVLALGVEHGGHRVLGQPIDLELGAEPFQFLGHGIVSVGVAELDGGGQVQSPLGAARAAGPGVRVHGCSRDPVYESGDQPCDLYRVLAMGQVAGRPPARLGLRRSARPPAVP